MGAINFAGLASGIDTNAIVDSLVAAARIPVTQLEQKKKNYNSQLSKLSDLSTKLTSLRTSAQGLDTAKELRSFTAESSDAAALTAVAGGSAVAGSYAIRVDALAQAERTYSKTYAAKDVAGIVNGTLNITVGSSSTSLSITNSDTLESIGTKINDANVGVTANVVYDGSQYRLLVSGNNTGAANAITFGGSAATRMDLSNAANQLQAATNASIRVDNMTITSSTNQFANAIPGLTLTAKKVTNPSTVTLTVGTNVDDIEKKLTQFVTDYNEVAKFIRAQGTFSGQARQDTLIGDASVRHVQSRLQSIVNSEVAAVGTSYNALSRIGITSNRDGTLALNTATLRAALAADLSSVSKLLTYTDNDESTDNDGVAVRLARAVGEMVNAEGTIDSRKDGISSSIRLIDDRISLLNRGLEKYESGLRQQFTQLENIINQLNGQRSSIAQL